MLSRHVFVATLIVPMLLVCPLVTSTASGPQQKTASAAPAAKARPMTAGPTRAQYLEYARRAADYTWAHQGEILARWKQGFDAESPFGYRPPGELLEMARIYAALYEKEKTPAHAERAKAILLQYGDHRAQYPEWAARARPDYGNGVPALPDFFTVMRYVRTFDTLHRLGVLAPDEVSRVEKVIAHSIEYLMQTAEWGAMNRAMLRAESLAWAVRALPRHPRAAVWQTERDALGNDNWGHWEIEDATIYHGVWLYALLGYADALDRIDDLFRTPQVFYYAQYFLNLMSPAGFVPDFGDAHWGSNWQHFLVFFEAAATRLSDPRMKWAAQAIAGRFVDFEHPTSSGLGCFLLDAYRWARDDVPAQAPASRSAEVMDDVQGKKIVFRDGWTPRSTYMLLTYRDEGDGGLNFRDYLRDTIPVEEEKMTHGHADENSIALLMSGGSVLLHDGGYRDYMPSGPFGAYRQDYFHNRLCIRPEKIFMGQSKGEGRYSTKDAVAGQAVLEFLRDAGSYRPVQTRKVDFLALPEFAYSRTRLIDPGWGYDWDRVIVHVDDPNLFVVFDVFKARSEEFFTLANLWHTRKIYAQGDHWYDTGYDAIGQAQLPGHDRLLVLFPATQFRLESVEPQRRHGQDELTISQTTGHHFELAETEAFVTVLVPHDGGQAAADLATRIQVVDAKPSRGGTAVRIQAGGRSVLVGVKRDLRMDMARDWRRPRYLYEQGRVAYGAFQTDGDLLFAVEDGGSLHYTCVNMTRLDRGDRTLFQAGFSYYGLAFDGSSETKGIGKVRYWRDTVKLDGTP